MNILTFDIEDWYCHDVESGNKKWNKLECRIYEGVDRILDSLAERNLKGTFFIVGWLAEHHPSIIRKIAEAGHQIGCHTYQHELLTNFDKKAMFEDTRKAKLLIEDAIGKKITAFRAPAFSITKENLYAFDVLGELGFTIDCSIFPTKRDFGGMPDYGASEPRILEHNGYQFKEFPINPATVLGKEIVFSGGGYFRLFPYSLIKRLTASQDYTMTYFHPSDFDPGQPDMSHLSIRQRIKNRIGLKSAYGKYLKYLDDFDFVNLETAIGVIDWDKYPKIVL